MPPRALATWPRSCPPARRPGPTSSATQTLSPSRSPTPSATPQAGCPFLHPTLPPAPFQAAQWSARPLSSSPHLGPRSSRLPETALEAFRSQAGQPHLPANHPSRLSLRCHPGWPRGCALGDRGAVPRNQVAAGRAQQAPSASAPSTEPPQGSPQGQGSGRAPGPGVARCSREASMPVGCSQ